MCIWVKDTSHYSILLLCIWNLKACSPTIVPLHYGAIVNWELEWQISRQDIHCAIPLRRFLQSTKDLIRDSSVCSLIHSGTAFSINLGVSSRMWIIIQFFYGLWASAVLRQIWIWSHKNRATVNKELEDDTGPWYDPCFDIQLNPLNSPTVHQLNYFEAYRFFSCIKSVCFGRACLFSRPHTCKQSTWLLPLD